MSESLPALRPGLVPFEDSRYLWQYPEMPQWIIRPVDTVRAHAWETANQSRELLRELNEEYGIEVVPFRVAVIGAETICYVSEKIEGRGFGTANGERINDVKGTDLTEQQLRVAKELVDKHHYYLLHKVISKAPFLTDIFGVTQYVLTADNRAILVDIESEVCDYPNHEDYPARMTAESTVFVHLSRSVAELFGETAARKEWQTRLETLLQVIGITNGLSVGRDAASELTRQALQEGLHSMAVDAVDDEIAGYLVEMYKKNARA